MLDNADRNVQLCWPKDRYGNEVTPGSRVVFADGDGRLSIGRVKDVKQKRLVFYGDRQITRPSSWQATVEREVAQRYYRLEAKIRNAQNILVLT